MSLVGAALQSKLAAEEYSEDPGERPRFAWVDKSLLFVDHRYQRQIGPDGRKHVNRIRKGFRYSLCSPLTVTEVGDLFAIIDGQHRWEAVKGHPGVPELPCWIIPASTLAAQAEAFESLNGARIGITRLQRFWAAHAAGKPIAVEIVKICAEAGITVTRAGGALPPLTTNSTFTLEKLLLAKRRVGDGLKSLARAHPKTPNAIRSAMIYAAVMVASGAARDRDPNELAGVLMDIDINDEISKATADRAVRGGTLEHTLTLRIGTLFAARDRFRRMR